MRQTKLAELAGVTHSSFMLWLNDNVYKFQQLLVNVFQCLSLAVPEKQ